jgi:hypothetical protein
MSEAEPVDQAQAEPEAKEKSPLQISLICIGGGLFLAVIGAGVPLLQASRQEHSATLYTKALIFAPLLLLFGIVYLVLGEKAKEMFGSAAAGESKVSKAGWVLIAVGIALCIAFYILVDRHLAGLGYQ